MARVESCHLVHALAPPRLPRHDANETFNEYIDDDRRGIVVFHDHYRGPTSGGVAVFQVANETELRMLDDPGPLQGWTIEHYPLAFSLRANGFVAQVDFTLRRYRGTTLSDLAEAEPARRRYWWRRRAGRSSADDFYRLMEALAEAWNRSDAAAASGLFTEDALYLEPPDKQVHRGRESLFEFFGGTAPYPMKMTWHHLGFNEGQQVGFGEYTYEGRDRYHGIVVVGVREGLVASWREYQYRSDMEWSAFVSGDGPPADPAS